MTRLWNLIRGATVADVSVLLAVLALISALLYPTWSARAFRERVASAIADVDALGAAARTSRAGGRPPPRPAMRRQSSPASPDPRGRSRARATPSRGRPGRSSTRSKRRRTRDHPPRPAMRRGQRPGPACCPSRAPWGRSASTRARRPCSRSSSGITGPMCRSSSIPSGCSCCPKTHERGRRAPDGRRLTRADSPRSPRAR